LREWRAVKATVTVACVQVEPVVLDREATVDKLAEHTAEAAGAGTELVAFPETFVSVFPSSVWAKALAGWSDPRAKTAFAQLFESVVGSQARLPIDSERSRGSTPPGSCRGK